MQLGIESDGRSWLQPKVIVTVYPYKRIQNESLIRSIAISYCPNNLPRNRSASRDEEHRALPQRIEPIFIHLKDLEKRVFI